MKKYKDSRVQYHVDNMLCIKLPDDVNVDWSEFEQPKIKYDTDKKKVIIELNYEELNE